MKKVLVVIATSVFLVAGLLVMPHVFAQATGKTAVATPGTASGAATPASAGQKGERHPEIRQAIHKLRAAKEDLEKATRDYAGHRVKAIQAIDQALEELKQALASDHK
jgi:hypothetical protein